MNSDEDRSLTFAKLQVSSVQYERRVVAFYDVLGWRSKIAEAGNDPAKIAELCKAVLLFSMLTDSKVFGKDDHRVSTFSDNVVVSTPVTEDDIGVLLVRLCLVQVRSALGGFLVRGGITVGDIFHDKSIVLGPALVRAYSLESEKAIYTRIVLDPETAELMRVPNIENITDKDGDLVFLDPFRLAFWRNAISLYARDADDAMKKRIEQEGDADFHFRSIMYKLKQELQETSIEKDSYKIHWLYDRLIQETLLQHFPPEMQEVIKEANRIAASRKP